MSDKSESVVLAYLHLSWNSGMFHLIRNLLSLDFHYKTTFADETLNLDQYIEFIKTFRRAIPDLVIQIDEVMSKKDRVITGKRFSGIIRKPIFGIPASETLITFPVVSLWKVNKGKITSLNTLMDIAGIERQLKTNLHPDKPLDKR